MRTIAVMWLLIGLVSCARSAPAADMQRPAIDGQAAGRAFATAMAAARDRRSPQRLAAARRAGEYFGELRTRIAPEDSDPQCMLAGRVFALAFATSVAHDVRAAIRSRDPVADAAERLRTELRAYPNDAGLARAAATGLASAAQAELDDARAVQSEFKSGNASAGDPHCRS